MLYYFELHAMLEEFSDLLNMDGLNHNEDHNNLFKCRQMLLGI